MSALSHVSTKDSKLNLTSKIKKRAADLGFDLVGVSRALPLPGGDFYQEWLEKGYAGNMEYMERNAEKRKDPGNLIEGALSVISVGMNYFVKGDSAPEDGGIYGRIAMYALGDDYHDHIKKKLFDLLEFIEEEYSGEVKGKAYVDTGPVLEREIGNLAGIGWYGKNTNLINKEIGSWLLLGEIVLNIELEYDEPALDHCGTCTACLDVCPTEALVDPYVLDSTLCISYLTIELKGPIPLELRPLVGDYIFGCDDCQDVCPWNSKAEETDEPAFQPRDGFSAPSLVSLMGMDDEAFRSRFKGSPIKRAKRRGFLRNVAVALGNSGKKEAIPVLVKSLRDDDPLIRGHSAWALGQIGGDEAKNAMEQVLEVENDEEVTKELEYALQSLNLMGTGLHNS